MNTRTKTKTLQQRGQIFRKAREALGMTIPQCAKKARTNKGMVERYERGTSLPRKAGVLDRMLAVIGLDDQGTPADVVGSACAVSAAVGPDPTPTILFASNGRHVVTKKQRKKSTIMALPIDRIVIKTAGRIDPNAVAHLKESIKHVTLLHPIVVRRMGKDFELITGEVRLAATKATGALTIQAKIVDVDDDEAETISLTENIDRKTFTPAERIRMVGRLKDLLSKHVPAGRGGDRKSASYKDAKESNGQVGAKPNNLTGELVRRTRMSKRAVARKTKIHNGAVPEVIDAIGNGINENDAEKIASMPKDKQLAELARLRQKTAGKKTDAPAAKAPAPQTAEPVASDPLDMVVSHLADATKIMRSMKGATVDPAKLDTVDRHLTMLSSMVRDFTGDGDDPVAK